MSYKMVDRLTTEGLIDSLQDEKNLERFKGEIRSLLKKMSVLPTARESEALPELEVIRDFSKFLVSPLAKDFVKVLEENEKLEQLVVTDLLETVSAAVIKAKIYNNKEIPRIADMIFVNALIYCTKNLKREKMMFWNLINIVIDKSADYYRSNGKESISTHPFGELLEGESINKNFLDNLDKGTKVDVLKSYGGKKNWSRGIVEGKEFNMIKVRYINDSGENYIQNKNSDLAPLGTKEDDFDWRENLKIGDFVDIYSFRSDWNLCKVIDIELEVNTHNETIKTFKVQKVEEGRMPDILEISQVKAHSPTLSKPGRFSSKSGNTIDDSEDVLYLAGEKKKRFAIIRTFANYTSSSSFLVKYINVFGENGGFDIIIEALNGKQANPEIISSMVKIVQSSCENLIEPFIKQNGEKIMNFLKVYLIETSEKNLRNLNTNNLSAFIEGIASLAIRIHKNTLAKREAQVLTMQIAIICLRSEFLDKQFFGAKLIMGLDSKAEGELTKTEVADLLVKEGIFERVVKGHPSLIAKSSGILRALLADKRLSENHLNLYWERICKSDPESKVSLLSALKDSLWELGIQDIRFFIRKMMLSVEDINSEIFELLFSLKKIALNKYDDFEVDELVTNVIWSLLQGNKDLGTSLLKEVINSFVKSIEGKPSPFIPLLFENLGFKEKLSLNLKVLNKLLKSDGRVSDQISKILKEKSIIQLLLNHVDILIKEVIQENQRVLTGDKRDILRRLFKLLTKLTNEEERGEVFKWNQVLNIWKDIFEADYPESLVLEWMKSVLVREPGERSLDDYKKFYMEYISKMQTKPKIEFYRFLMMVFQKINLVENHLYKKNIKLETSAGYGYKTVKKTCFILACPVDNLFGFEETWKLFRETTDMDMINQICINFTKVYFPPENCGAENHALYFSEKNKLIQKLKEIFSLEPLMAEKVSVLLVKLIRREEKTGYGKLCSMASLKEGDKVTLLIEKDTKYFREKFRLYLNESSSIAELREKIASEYRMKLDSVKLTRENGFIIDFSESSLTLEQVGLRARESIVVSEGEVPEEEDVSLMYQDRLSPQAVEVFKEIFENYSVHGKMTREQLAKFISDATDSYTCTISDERVIGFFESYDLQNKGHVLEADFIDYFTKAVKTSHHKMSTVKQNLISLGYTKDLCLKKNKKMEVIGNIETIRRQLTEDSKFFHTLIAKSGSSQEINNLLSLSTPSKSFLLEFYLNPGSFIDSAVNFVQIEAYCTLLDNLLFKTDVLEIMKNMKLNYSSDGFVAQLSKTLVTKLITKLFSLKANETQGSIHGKITILKPIERLLRLLSSFKLPNFISMTSNLASFSISQRKAAKRDEIKEAPKPQMNSRYTQILGEDKTYGPEPDKKDEEENPQKEEDLLNSLKLSEEYLKDVLSTCFETEFSIKLTDILFEIFTSKSDLVKAEKTLLCICLNSLLAVLMKNESSVSEQIQRLIDGLEHRRPYIRIYLKNFFSFYLNYFASKASKSDLLKLFIDKIQKGCAEEASIELASGLLAELSDKKNSLIDEQTLHSTLNLSQLFQEFSHKLIEHRSLDNDEREDQLLIAYLTFMEKILLADELVLKEMEYNYKKTLIVHLFKQCLFDISGNSISFGTVKCKSKRARSNALSLLVNLVKKDNKASVLIMVSCFYPLSKMIPELSPYSSFSSEYDKKSSLGYLGIKNLGCICYMSAMLQQFYCTPAFRYGVLLAEDLKAISETEIKGRKFDDNVFHQFQKMFSYLDLSERRDYNPTDFCLSYKDYSGEPVNVMIQQDSQEFLNMIFEKLEGGLKNTPFKGILDSVFGGKTANVFTCSSCGFERSNIEPFFNLSLEVKHLEDLNDSFKKFIKDETISDYTCDNCKKKCDVSKRCYLKSLPNVLIIHLQKIIFDLDSLVNIKIGTKYKFPMNSNLKDYVKKEEGDNFEDSDFEYRLVGVVVHRGNAEFGHYTSLINVNRKDPNNRADKDLWLEFDDSRVSKFDMSRFEEECFGGSNDDKEGGISSFALDYGISKSAYILVYDKVKKSQIKFELNEQTLNEKDKIISCLINKSNFIFIENVFMTDFYNIGVYFPPSIKAEIDEDNSSLILEQQLLGSSFTNNFAEFISNANLPIVSLNSNLTTNLELDVYQKALCETFLNSLVNFLFKVYFISSENIKISKVLKGIETALILNPHRSFTFFSEHISANLNLLCNYMINSSDLLVRSAASDLVSTSIIVTLRSIQPTQTGNLTEEEQVIYNLLTNLFTLIPSNEQSSSYRKLSSYFSCLSRMASYSTQIRDIYLKANILTRMFDLYISQEPAKVITHEKALSPCLSLISILLSEVKQREISSTDSNAKNHLKEYFNYFVRIEFINKILKEDYRFNNYEALKEILIITCENNLELSLSIIYSILKGINSASDLEMIGYLEGIKALLSIDDQFTMARIKNIFGIARLNDNKVKVSGNKIYSYGASKESSMKRAVYSFISPYGLEKSYIELLCHSKDINESATLLMIFYLIEYMESNPKIIGYILRLPPINYISATIYDFFRAYVDYQMKVLPTSYNCPKPELMLLYFNNLGEKINNFEKKLIKYYADEGINITNSTKLFSNDDFNEIFCSNELYILGNTTSSKTICERALDTDDVGTIGIKVVAVNLLYIESHPNGHQNLSFPKSFYNYETYINRSAITEKSFSKFFGINESYSTASDSKLFIDPTEEDFEKKQFSQDETHCNYEESEMVLRISIFNKTLDNYILKLTVNTAGLENDSEEFIFSVRNKKSGFLVHNLLKKDPESSFKGLTISAAIKKSESLSLKSLNIDELEDLGVIFKYE